MLMTCAEETYTAQDKMSSNSNLGESSEMTSKVSTHSSVMLNCDILTQHRGMVRTMVLEESLLVPWRR